jgi:nucleoid-associated protein YgaU
MGLFDKMFGRGASEDEKAQKRFNDLRQKYISVLNFADQQQLQFQNLHVEDDKLLIRATAPSQDVANQVWDQVKLVNPNLDDITLDLKVAETRSQGAAASPETKAVQPSGQTSGQSYTVQAGDSLSKISKHFYGDASEFMRIFYANRDKLNDPNKIQVGQQLTIPPDTDA